MSGVAELAVQQGKAGIRRFRSRVGGGGAKSGPLCAFPDFIQTHFILEDALSGGVV